MIDNSNDGQQRGWKLALIQFLFHVLVSFLMILGGRLPKSPRTPIRAGVESVGKIISRSASQRGCRSVTTSVANIATSSKTTYHKMSMESIKKIATIASYAHMRITLVNAACAAYKETWIASVKQIPQIEFADWVNQMYLKNKILIKNGKKILIKNGGKILCMCSYAQPLAENRYFEALALEDSILIKAKEVNSIGPYMPSDLQVRGEYLLNNQFKWVRSRLCTYSVAKELDAAYKHDCQIDSYLRSRNIEVAPPPRLNERFNLSEFYFYRSQLEARQQETNALARTLCDVKLEVQIFENDVISYLQTR